MSFESYTDFYNRHYRLILTVAEQRLGGFSDAEDITAEVFRIAWMHHQQGNELSLPWVYRVLRNVIGNEYRRRDRVGSLIDRAGDDLWLDNLMRRSPEEVVSIRQVLLTLPLDDRELLYMAFWEDLTRAEMAEILGITSGALRVRLTRAKRRLKHLLADREISTRDGAQDGRA